MSVERFAVSLEADLAREIRTAVESTDAESISAWLADAARWKLMRLELTRAVADFEAEQGNISDEELQEARNSWPTD